jgi:DNA-binding NtrC family response regulator
MADILVVDDDRSIATAFEHFLAYEGHQFRLASSATDGLAAIAARRPDLVVMDVRMPGMDGLTALQQMRDRDPELPVVIMTAHGTSQTSIDAIRRGAFDYLTKPLDLDSLRDVITRVTAEPKLVDGDADDSTPLVPAPVLTGASPVMQAIYKLIGRLATNDVVALITGEAGTGRHLVATTIHANSGRRELPIVHVPSGTTSEAELTVMLQDPAIGTLHLAGVDALSLTMQARVAAAIRDAQSSGTASRPRLLASTAEDVAAATRDGRLSRELVEAISVITLDLPPLRERRDDIPELVQHFVTRANAELGRAFKGVEDAAAKRLQQHAWPGNVGELERVIRRACIVARGQAITLADLGDSLDRPAFAAAPDAEPALARAVRQALHDRLVKSSAASAYHAITTLVETTLVDEALAITNGNQLKASSLLGLNRTTLRKKIPDA